MTLVEDPAVETTRDTVAGLLAEVADLGRDPVRGGYSRPVHSPAETELREWFAAHAERRRLEAETGRNGIIWAWAPASDGSRERAVVTGSHLDSVPGGGAFDGPLGVASALGRPVAVASSILGHGRWRVSLTGEGNHAGTTLMGDRRDPMVAASQLVVRIRAVAKRLAAGEGCSATMTEESLSPTVDFDAGLREELLTVLPGVPRSSARAQATTPASSRTTCAPGCSSCETSRGGSHSPAETVEDDDAEAGAAALALALADSLALLLRG